MDLNVTDVEIVPRIVAAMAAGVGAVFAPRGLIRGSLLLIAGSLLTTVATRSCPLNRILGRPGASPQGWRTLRTWRVEPPPE
jgi:hypothetical protein